MSDANENEAGLTRYMPTPTGAEACALTSEIRKLDFEGWYRMEPRDFRKSAPVYLCADVDPLLAAKDAEIADRDEALTVALAEGLELMEVREMLKDRESDLEFEHGERVKAEAQVEELRKRIAELEATIQSQYRTIDAFESGEDDALARLAAAEEAIREMSQPEPEPEDPPVTRRELARVLRAQRQVLVGSHGTRTLKEYGQPLRGMVERLERGEDARGAS